MMCRGTRLREAMKVRGFKKQYALAVSLQVNESTVTRWLSGGPMSLESAIEVCQALDISLDWLVLGRGEMYPPQNLNESKIKIRSLHTEVLGSNHIILTLKSQKLLELFITSLDAQ